MKLIINNETFQAEKILKENNNIIGYNADGSINFAHKGITDFTQFQLQDENGNNIELPIPPLTEIELLQNDMDEIYAQFLKVQGVAINV